MNPTLLMTAGSRGIGAATARLAAQRGYAMAVNYTSHAEAANEVALEGIRVNAVRPGIIETDIHASGGKPERAQQMATMVPMQRAGSSAGDYLAAVSGLQRRHGVPAGRDGRPTSDLPCRARSRSATQAACHAVFWMAPCDGAMIGFNGRRGQSRVVLQASPLR